MKENVVYILNSVFYCRLLRVQIYTARKAGRDNLSGRMKRFPL